MTDAQTMHLLMTDLGPLLDAASIREFKDEALWVIQMDESTMIMIDFDESNQKLTISTDIAQIPSEEKTAWYELFLRYNAEWVQTGGVRIALDQASGAILAYDFHSGVDVTGLQTLIMNFLQVLIGWREILSKPVTTDEPDFSNPMGDFRNQGFIKV